MPEYQLQIKQVVDYPRCRIYREFIHKLINDRSIRINGGSGLFHFTVLCSYANFRTSYRRIDGISYTVSPGEWVCTVKELSCWFRTRFHRQALSMLDTLQKQHLISYTLLGRGNVVKYKILHWARHNSALEYNAPCQKDTGFFFLPVSVALELVSSARCSEMDIVLDRFLEENFALEHFLLAPLSRFGLMLEDKTGEKIAFAFLNDCVQEIPVPAPAAPETVIAFLKQFRNLTPRPVVHDFEALTRWWLDNPNPLTYQQALGMSDDLYHHFLSHPLISEDDALRLARKGLVTESEYNDLQLWYFNGHTMSCWFGPLGVDGTGSLYGLTFDYQTASPTKTQFYLLDDYYRVMNHLTE